jgi:hypothetical protein
MRPYNLIICTLLSILGSASSVSDTSASRYQDSTALAPACPCTNSSWCAPVALPPRPEVFAFHVTGNSNSIYWKTYDWDIITTLAVFGSIDTDLMCYAHSMGAKIVLGVSFDNVRELE